MQSVTPEGVNLTPTDLKANVHLGVWLDGAGTISEAASTWFESTESQLNHLDHNDLAISAPVPSPDLHLIRSPSALHSEFYK